MKTIKNIDEMMHSAIKDKSNVARVFNLSNNAAINKFRKEESSSLSNSTYIKLGKELNFNMIRLMVPEDLNDDILIEKLNKLNESFIDLISSKLENDKKVKVKKVDEVKEVKEEVKEEDEETFPEDLFISDLTID